MDAYSRKPRDVVAKQWDGTRASMYLVAGELLNLRHVVHIRDGYESQGPDLMEVQTRNGMEKVLENDWVVKDGAYLTVMKDAEFQAEFEKTVEPKKPVMRGGTEE